MLKKDYEAKEHQGIVFDEAAARLRPWLDEKKDVAPVSEQPQPRPARGNGGCPCLGGSY